MNTIFKDIIKPLSLDNGIATIADIKALLETPNAALITFMKNAYNLELPLVLKYHDDDDLLTVVEIEMLSTNKILLLGDSPEELAPHIMTVPSFLALSVTSPKTDNIKTHVTTYELNENALIVGYVIYNAIERIVADYMSSEYVDTEQFDNIDALLANILVTLIHDAELEF